MNILLAVGFKKRPGSDSKKIFKQKNFPKFPLLKNTSLFNQLPLYFIHGSLDAKNRLLSYL